MFSTAMKRCLSAVMLFGLWALPEADAQYIATSNDNICAGDVVNLYVNVTGWYDDPTDSNPADWSFTWTPAELFATNTTQSVSFTPTESVTVQCTAIAPDGDDLYLAINLDVYPAFTVDAGMDVLTCTTDGIQLQATSDSPANLNWLWEPAIGLSDPTVPSPTVVGEVTQLYTVTAEVNEPNGDGCTASDFIEVASVQPSVDLGPDVVACTGEEVVLQSGYASSVDHDWTVPGASGPTVTLTASATVGLTITTADGCEAEDEVTVVFSDGPVLDLPAEVTFCSSNGTALDATPVDDATGPFLFAWSTGGSGPEALVYESGEASVTVTDAGGCSTTATVALEALPSPELHLPSDTTFCFEDFPDATYLLSVPGGFAGYSWNTGSPSNVQVVNGPGLYSVSVTNTIGCTTTESTWVKDFCSMPLLWVPNAFSPDGDGMNEVLRIEGRNIVDLEFVIYDRWGNEVWRTTELGSYWHGAGPGGRYYTADGQYVWRARYRSVVDPAGNLSLWQEAGGSITVLR